MFPKAPAVMRVRPTRTPVEDVLPHYPAEGHAEGHPLVLHKEDLEPVSQHGEMLSQGHMGFDQDLDDLVDDHQKNAQKKKPGAFGKTPCHYFLPVFSRMAFPSTVVVACGTRRRRSLGMSLPVTRQMPYVLFSIRTRAASRFWMNLY